MKIAICYFSATGRTEAMAGALEAGIRRQAPNCEVKRFHIDSLDASHPENVAFVNASDGVVFGTPDYYAAESWQMKHWLDTCPCKLAGKLGGVFATANVPVGGPGSVSYTHLDVYKRQVGLHLLQILFGDSIIPILWAVEQGLPHRIPIHFTHGFFLLSIPIANDRI